MPDSIHAKLLADAVVMVKHLALAGITEASIKEIWLPEKSAKFAATLPAIHVSPFGQETFGEGTNRGDDIQYPIGIYMMDDANRGSTTEIDERLLWREKILDHFIHNRLSVALTNAVICDQLIEPGPIVDNAAWYGRNIWLSALVVRVMVRKRRRAT